MILGELSLSGPWSIGVGHGAHLTFVASEDFRQTAMVVPSHPSHRPTRSPCAARRASAARAFVEALDGSSATRSSRARRASSTRCSPIASRRRLLPHAQRDQPAAGDGRGARRAARNRRLPAFADHQSQFPLPRRRSRRNRTLGHASSRARRAPSLSRTWCWCRWSRSTRKGRGSARARAITTACSAACGSMGALLIGIGWQVQMLDEIIPPTRGTSRSTASPRRTGWRCSGDEPEPSWRKPAGIFAILALIIVWAALVALAGRNRRMADSRAGAFT